MVQALIEPARKSLYATLLFSALTGYNQGRTGREASLLVLYNKNQSAKKDGTIPEIVRVFDMGSIVLDIIDNNRYDEVKVSPKMDKPLFDNEYEETASLRITKVLQ